MSVRAWFWLISFFAFAAVGAASVFWPHALWALAAIVPPFLLGLWDMTQRTHAVLRNFPIIGHGRYLLELIRPEINQYFVESNTDGTPFNREQRSVVYQRAKGVLDTLPFGTQMDVYQPGYEWIEHSMRAKHLHGDPPRVTVGGPDCKQPYSASLYNVSAMSYGSLSKNAVLALNRGAKQGGFAHNTGEGGVSPYHLQGGDLVWQVGTGYFGCRADDGGFSAEKFEKNAGRPEVKMIEIKLSQGAKPGHGGILPAGKVTPEIAEIRGVPLGKDVLSPPAHSAFSTPRGLLEFVAKLRELSGGKPIGFKLCVGRKREFLAICKAMVETGIKPDFITVDGGEGGTGAAPIEFSNRVGMPLTESLIFVHNALRGIGVRDDIKVIASGKIMSGFAIARAIALGANLCNSARGMMFAVGCIQARRCNANDCPAGVATHKPHLVQGLDVTDKTARVVRFHESTIKAFVELLGAAGFERPEELRPWHIHRRTDMTRTTNYGSLYHYLPDRALLNDTLPDDYALDWAAADADCF
jgi:glutamate synthase domain-containing protein 2